jgi:hypothetical protein
MDRYECVDCWGLVEATAPNSMVEPKMCTECKQQIPSVAFYNPIFRTYQFKCQDCGRVYTGTESMYDTEARPRVELKSYTGRKLNKKEKT